LPSTGRLNRIKDMVVAPFTRKRDAKAMIKGGPPSKRRASGASSMMAYPDYSTGISGINRGVVRGSYNNNNLLKKRKMTKTGKKKNYNGIRKSNKYSG